MPTSWSCCLAHLAGVKVDSPLAIEAVVVERESPMRGLMTPELDIPPREDGRVTGSLLVGVGSNIAAFSAEDAVRPFVYPIVVLELATADVERIEFGTAEAGRAVLSAGFLLPPGPNGIGFLAAKGVPEDVEWLWP